MAGIEEGLPPEPPPPPPEPPPPPPEPPPPPLEPPPSQSPSTPNSPAEGPPVGPTGTGSATDPITFPNDHISAAPPDAAPLPEPPPLPPEGPIAVPPGDDPLPEPPSLPGPDQDADRLSRDIPGSKVELMPGDLPPQESHVMVDPDGKPVFVLPEITIHGRPEMSADGGAPPSHAGEPYLDAAAAARAALGEIDEPSVDADVEYAGNIYRNPDGTFSFSPPVPGDRLTSRAEDSKVPPGATVVATYHSHAGEFAPSDEYFSANDKFKARPRPCRHTWLPLVVTS